LDGNLSKGPKPKLVRTESEPSMSARERAIAEHKDKKIESEPKKRRKKKSYSTERTVQLAEPKPDSSVNVSEPPHSAEIKRREKSPEKTIPQRTKSVQSKPTSSSPKTPLSTSGSTTTKFVGRSSNKVVKEKEIDTNT